MKRGFVAVAILILVTALIIVIQVTVGPAAVRRRFTIPGEGGWTMSEVALKRLFLEYVDVVAHSSLPYQEMLHGVIKMARDCLAADEEICYDG